MCVCVLLRNLSMPEHVQQGSHLSGKTRIALRGGSTMCGTNGVLGQHRSPQDGAAGPRPPRRDNYNPLPLHVMGRGAEIERILDGHVICPTQTTAQDECRRTVFHFSLWGVYADELGVLTGCGEHKGSRS